MRNYLGKVPVLVRNGNLFWSEKLEKYYSKPLKFLDKNFVFPDVENVIKKYNFKDGIYFFAFYFSGKILYDLQIRELPPENSAPLKLVIHKNINWQRIGNCIFDFLSNAGYWAIYYKSKSYDGFLCLNHKGRIVKSDLGDLIVFWRKNLYYTDLRDSFFSPNPIIRFLYNGLKKEGVKKLIGKGNGLSVRLLSEADEVYVLTPAGIASVKSIRFGKNVFSYKKISFFDQLQKRFERYGKKILRGLEGQENGNF